MLSRANALRKQLTVALYAGGANAACCSLRRLLIAEM